LTGLTKCSSKPAAFEAVDLLPVLLDAVESTKRQIATAGHQLSVSLAHDALYVDGDIVRLEQVFTNLLSNAARYTDRGGRIELLQFSTFSNSERVPRGLDFGESVESLPCSRQTSAHLR
jgi:K+-sensing histidine kinase KdpD